jgi:hypothetical protein
MMKKRDRTVIQKIAIAVLILEAVGWLGLIPVYLIWMSKGTAMDIILMILMGGNGIAFSLLARGMIRGKKLWWILSIIWVGLNLVLTFTDQFGAADWAALIANGGVLMLLIIGGYKSRSEKEPG